VIERSGDSLNGLTGARWISSGGHELSTAVVGDTVFGCAFGLPRIERFAISPNGLLLQLAQRDTPRARKTVGVDACPSASYAPKRPAISRRV